MSFAQAVGILKNNPTFLHKKELAFFRDYLQSFGATIPSLESMEEAERKKSEGHQGKAEADHAGHSKSQIKCSLSPVCGVVMKTTPYVSKIYLNTQ